MLISDVLRDKGGEVITVRTSDKVSVVVKKLAERRIGAVMVEEHLKPVGIFSERDLLNALARSGARVMDYEVRELMTAPFLSAGPADRVDAVLGLMTVRRIRHMPVLRGAELVGLVSIGDLVKHRLDEKEMEANVLLDITRRHG